MKTLGHEIIICKKTYMIIHILVFVKGQKKGRSPEIVKVATKHHPNYAQK